MGVQGCPAWTIDEYGGPLSLSLPFGTQDRPETLSPTLPRYPCLASMEVDPELSDTLMHLSGYIFRAAIDEGLRRK